MGLLVIFAAALLIRLHPILVTPESIRVGFGPFGDSYLYHTIGYNLYKGHGYSGLDNGSAFGLPEPTHAVVYEPAITRGPVYPMFLASVYHLWGHEADMDPLGWWDMSWDRVRIVQAVLDAMLCLFLYYAVRRIYPDRYAPAFLVTALYCVSFYNIYYTRMLLSESVTTLLITIGITTSVMIMKSGRTVLWVIPGAAFGLASLARPEYILFPFFLAAFIIFIQRYQIKGAIRSCILLIFGLILVIAPWTVRNYKTFNRFIPTSVGAMGLNLFTGTYENGDWQGWHKLPDRILKNPRMKKNVETWGGKLDFHSKRGTIGIEEFDLKFRTLALSIIKEDPLKCVGVWIKRLPRLWYQNYIQMYVYREPSGLWFIFYFTFSVLAMMLMKKEMRIVCAPIFLLFVYMNLVYLPFHIEPRYSVTMYPGLCFLAAIGLWLSFTKLSASIRIMKSS
jgi:hypothetical protein